MLTIPICRAERFQVTVYCNDCRQGRALDLNRLFDVLKAEHLVKPIQQLVAERRFRCNVCACAEHVAVVVARYDVGARVVIDQWSTSELAPPATAVAAATRHAP